MMLHFILIILVVILQLLTILIHIIQCLQPKSPGLLSTMFRIALVIHFQLLLGIERIWIYQNAQTIVWEELMKIKLISLLQEFTGALIILQLNFKVLLKEVLRRSLRLILDIAIRPFLIFFFQVKYANQERKVKL